MAEMREMHADLMRAAGLEPALDQRGERGVARAEGLENFVARPRGLALTAQHRHAFSIEWAAADIAFNHSSARARLAPDDSVVGALHRVRGELLGQAAHSAFVLGDHKQAAGVLVQPVHNAGPRDAPDARERGTAMG